MPSDAQRLISISLSKIAGSRTQKGNFSLHKNLLVATVLQKARFAFMEETFQFMTSVQESELLTPVDEVEPEFEYMNDFVESAAARIAECCDKENMCEQSVTYLDLDTNKSTNSRDVLVSTENREQRKRRRTVSESETEEAVLSILPKRHRSESELSPSESTNPANAMDVDHITSLVSIFSFGGRCPSDGSKLTRSVSTPDLCSTQASKDEIVNMQRPYLAMTV